MKRSQLTDGLQIILRNDGGDGDIELRKGHLLDYKNKTITSLLDYNEDLTHKKDKDLDIVKIIKGMDIIWDRMELDWTQIPVGTPVLVSSDGEDWYERYFVVRDKVLYKSVNRFGTPGTWEYCKLTEESFGIAYDVVIEEYNQYCGGHKHGCEGCNYTNPDINCKSQFIDDHFNITRK